MLKHNKESNSKLQMVLIIIITALISSGITTIVFLIILNHSPSSEASATQPTTIAGDKATNDTPALNKESNPNNHSLNESTSQETLSQEQASHEQGNGAVAAPEELMEMAAENGSDFTQFDFDQLITVKSEGTTAVISFYEKQNNSWVKAGIESEEGFVGNMGVSPEASETTSYTPQGLYSLGTAFGIKPNPGTAMDYFDVTEDSYWVDDPESQYYNQHIEGTENSDWSTAEHLIDNQPNYNYSVFIEYNTQPAVKGMGSAFFMHVGSAPTAGCVAVSEAKMIETLQWLNKEKSPHILIL